MADPGFPRGGVHQLQRWGCQPIIFANFPQKLHEIEEIWTEREGTSVPGAPPPLKSASDCSPDSNWSIIYQDWSLVECRIGVFCESLKWIGNTMFSCKYQFLLQVKVHILLWITQQNSKLWYRYCLPQVCKAWNNNQYFFLSENTSCHESHFRGMFMTHSINFLVAHKSILFCFDLLYSVIGFRIMFDSSLRSLLFQVWYHFC